MAWTSNKDSVGALGYPAELVTNNPEKYGIIFADDISGHRQVKDLATLYSIPTAILSKSKTNDHSDALGLKWYVLSNKKHYRLKDWNNRTNENGWELDTLAVDRITGVNYTISTPSATTASRDIQITGLNPHTNETVTSSVTVPVASNTAAGFLSSTHKKYLDSLGTIQRLSHIKHSDNDGITSTEDDVSLNFECIGMGETSISNRSLSIGAASETRAGVMTSADKVKEDRITGVNYTISTPSATTTTRNIQISGLDPSTNEAVTSAVSIPSATSTAAGLMNSDDKLIVGRLNKLGTVSHMKDSALFTRTATDVNINYYCKSVNSGGTDVEPTENSKSIGAATTTLAGVMPAADYIVTNNLRKLTTVSHLKHDNDLFTTTATGVSINYDCIGVSSDLNVTSRSKALPVATNTTAGIIAASSLITINQLRKIGVVTHMGDNNLFTTTATGAKMHYKCIGVTGTTDVVDWAIEMPMASTTGAGLIDATEKKKLNAITYVDETENVNTAGISKINFSAGSTDGVWLLTDNSQDNTKLVVSFMDNFGINDTTDLFQIRGIGKTSGSDTGTNIVRFQVGKTVKAINLTSNELERILTTTDLIPFDNISKLTSFSHINDTTPFTTYADNVKLNYRCVDTSGALTDHAATIPAVTTTKAGVMTAADKVNFDELCLLTYGNNTSVSLGGTSVIEKGVSTSVTINWDAKFNGSAITPTTVSVKRGSTVLSSSTTNKSLTDTISDNATYTLTITYRGVTKTATKTVYAYYPKYYGGSTKTTLTSADITALTKLAITASANGTNSVTCADNQYIWFCVPNSMVINKVTMGGFAFPIEAAKTVTVTGKGSYKCYRSSNLMSAGTRSFVIS